MTAKRKKNATALSFMVDDDSADRVNAASYSCRLTLAIPSQELQYALVEQQDRAFAPGKLWKRCWIDFAHSDHGLFRFERSSGLASGAGLVELNGL